MKGAPAGHPTRRERHLAWVDAERRHLLDLVRTSGATRAPRRTPLPRVRPTVQYVLDAITGAPAIVNGAEAGRNPYARNLSDLIGELSTRSNEFRTRWASHDVRIHATGTKRLHHPVVGDLDLSYESFLMPDQGQSLLVYVAEPSSPSHDALNLLASYAATRQVDSGEARRASRERLTDRSH